MKKIKKSKKLKKIKKGISTGLDELDAIMEAGVNLADLSTTYGALAPWGGDMQGGAFIRFDDDEPDTDEPFVLEPNPFVLDPCDE